MNNLVRLICYLKDGPFFDKRWSMFTGKHCFLSENKYITTRSYEGVKTKDEDPRWRENQPWILFRFENYGLYYPIFFPLEASGVHWQKVKPIKNKLFAMRVSREQFSVSVHTSGSSSDYFAPKIVSGLVDPHTYDEIIALAKQENEQVTFI